MRALVELRLLRAAIPAELGQHDGFPGPRDFAHDAFQIGEVGQFVILALVLVGAACQGIEVDFQEVQQLGLPLGTEAGVVGDAAPESGRDGSLQAAHGGQRLGVGGLDRRHLPAGPFIGEVLAEGLEVEQLAVAERILRRAGRGSCPAQADWWRPRRRPPSRSNRISSPARRSTAAG